MITPNTAMDVTYISTSDKIARDLVRRIAIGYKSRNEDSVLNILRDVASNISERTSLEIICVLRVSTLSRHSSEWKILFDLAVDELDYRGIDTKTELMGLN